LASTSLVRPAPAPGSTDHRRRADDGRPP
jgi:hypothetical protein